MDGRRYPQVARYLASLPDGLASHPQCKAKNAGLKILLDGSGPFPSERGSLPDAVLDLIAHPPPASTWSPEVLFVALALSFRDSRFASDAEWLDWMYEVNARMFRSPIYRLMMAVATPAMLAKGAAPRWHQFHQGSELALLSFRAKLTEFTLRFPMRLFPALYVQGFGKAFEAAVAAAGGLRPEAKLLAIDDTGARLRLSWS